MRARKIWIWLCIILMCALFWVPIIPPLAYSIYFDLIEKVGIEYLYIGDVGSNDSHGSGTNVLQSDFQNHGGFMWVTFDQLDSMVYWETPIPTSKKLKVKSSLAKGSAVLKITQGTKWNIQKIPLIPGEQTIINVSEWGIDENIFLWLGVSDGENGQFIITSVPESCA